jgi:hypothetical protein
VAAHRRLPLGALLFLILGLPQAAADCRNALFVTDVEHPSGGPVPYDFEVWFDCVSNGTGHAYSAVVEGPGTADSQGPVYDQWQGADCDDRHEFVLRKPGEYFVTLRCDGVIEDTKFFTVSGGGPVLPEGMGTFLLFLAVVGIAVGVGVVATRRKKPKRGTSPTEAPFPSAAPPLSSVAWEEVPDPTGAGGALAARAVPERGRSEGCTLEAERTLACPHQKVTFTVQCSQPLASVKWKGGGKSGQATPKGASASFAVQFPAAPGTEATTQEVTVECRTATGGTHGASAAVRVRALSGPAWVAAYGFDNEPSALESPFREQVARFQADLRAAGATCTVTSVYRDPRRQYLMWGSSLIARHRVTPLGVEEDPRGDEGVEICWCHRGKDGEPAPDPAHKAARAMADLFGGLTWGAQRKGNHPLRRAVDMQVRWRGPLELPGWPPIRSEPRDETNPDLHQAARWYGVVHFVPRVGKDGKPRGDAVHWSSDGT